MTNIPLERIYEFFYFLNFFFFFLVIEAESL